MGRIENLKAAILAQLPQDGSNIGNRKMQTQLGLLTDVRFTV